MATLAEKRDALVEELRFMEDPQERIGYLIDSAKDREPLPADLKIDPFKVEGCQSQLWIVPEFRDGRCYFMADSDALITKGIAGVLADLYSDAEPAEVIAMEPDFLADVGITAHLTPNRRNGLTNVRKRIKSFAEGCRDEAAAAG